MTLIDHIVDGDTICPRFDAEVLSVDTIYYSGVRDCIHTWIKNGDVPKAYVIFNAYTSTEGDYTLNYGEGSFKIYSIDGVKMVKMNPEDNADPYTHELFKWNPYSVGFRTRTIDGVIYHPIKRIETSPHSCIYLMELIKDISLDPDT